MGWTIPAILFRRGGDTPTGGGPGPGSERRLRRPDGSELHVEIHGPDNGPVLVFTHGWSLNCREWDYARDELSRHYQIMTWDLPGLGQSSGPASKDWSLEKMAGDLDAVVALADDRPVILVGHSIGGMILLTYCRLFPDSLGSRVRGLVIGQSTYTNPTRTASMAKLFTALQKPLLEPLCYLMIWCSPLLYVFDWLSYLNGSAHRSTERSSFSGRESRWQLDRLTRCWVGASPAVVARGFLGMFRYDATATLDTIPVPALIVAGDRDPLCVPEAGVYMAERMPNASLVTLPNSKHCGLFEHHREFNERVEKFASACFSGEPVARVVDSRNVVVHNPHCPLPGP